MFGSDTSNWSKKSKRDSNGSFVKKNKIPLSAEKGLESRSALMCALVPIVSSGWAKIILSSLVCPDQCEQLLFDKQQNEKSKLSR